MEEIIAQAGLPEHSARYLAYVCKAQGWTEDDVKNLVELATTSASIRSPAAFVRHRITHNIKDSLPPRPKTFGQILSELACPECHQYPCCCDWDQGGESYLQFKERVYGYKPKLQTMEFPTVQVEAGVV